MRNNTPENEASAPSLFSTVLVARQQNVQPSALELALRSNCQRLRVVENLSGAHLLLPSGDISVAVRAYFSEDCQRLTNSSQPKLQSTGDGGKISSHGDEATQCLIDWHQGMGLSADVDGLVAFRNSFKYSLVIMIMVEDEQIRQLSRADSFFHRVQGIMNGGCNRTESDLQHKMARVIVVPSISSAMSVLTSVGDTLLPARRERKTRYYAQQQKKWFLHPDTTSLNSSNDFAAELAANAFREWAVTKLPDGDENVILDVLGRLKAIASANDQILEDVPIDVRSQHILQSFFGSKGDQQPLVPQPPQQPLEFHSAAGIDRAMMTLNPQVPYTYVPQQQPPTYHLANGGSGERYFPCAPPSSIYPPPQPFATPAASAPSRQKQQRRFGRW